MSAIIASTLPGDADRRRVHVLDPANCSHTSMRKFLARRAGTSDEKTFTLCSSNGDKTVREKGHKTVPLDKDQNTTSALCLQISNAVRRCMRQRGGAMGKVPNVYDRHALTTDRTPVG